MIRPAALNGSSWPDSGHALARPPRGWGQGENPRDGAEESLLATLETAVSLIAAAARIQMETAQVLRDLAVRKKNEDAIQQLIDAEGTVRAPATFPGGRRAQLDRPQSLQRPPDRREKAIGRAEPLTAREQAVLRLLRGTLSLRGISQELYVSQNTIKSHVKAIYRKLGVSSRPDAIQCGRELGLL